MELSESQLEEIRLSRASSSSTLRSTVSALEEILHQPIPVLDHGFLRVVDYMGSDDAIVQAARVSYGRGTRKVSDDRSLIMYLMRHAHTTPFEMAEIKLHVKLPIFVARQWIRHRTASVNEYSARYSILDKEFYIPSPEQLAAQSQNNRQGRGAELSADEARQVMDLLRRDAEQTYHSYQWMLNESSSEDGHDANRSGVARELARINLTLNTYTQWYWKTNLHNFMGFLRLRADPHAQFEIRAYAEVMLGLLERWTPHTYAAFMEYRLQAVQLSRSAVQVIKRLLSGDKVTAKTSGLTSREWLELVRLFSLDES